MKKLILFSIFILSLFFSFQTNKTKINLPYFGRLYKDVSLDIIFENKKPKVYFDDKIINSKIKITDKHFQFKDLNCGLIKKIKIEGGYEKAMVFIGNDVVFLNQEKEISIDNSKKPYVAFGIGFLALFYNFHLFILPWIFFFLLVKNYLPKKQFLSQKKALFLIILLSLFLRCVQLNNIPFWDDEIYVLAHCAKGAGLIELFNDPGNPPLYFALFKLFHLFVQKEAFLRLSSVLLGVILNILFYFYLKFWLGEKKALFGAFFASISLVLIYFSQEIRCYCLFMVLALALSLLLFKFNSKKNKFLYLITSISLLYTHFYGAFFVLYNFIFGSILFSKPKKRKKLRTFLILNLISFLSYVPLILYKKMALVNSFNSWIKKPTFLDLAQTLDIFSRPCGICFSVFVFLVIFSYAKEKNKKEKLFIRYNFHIIFFVIFLALCFSFLIKPIFVYRYFYPLYPYYISLITFLVCKKFKLGFSIIPKVLIFLFLGLSSFINRQNLFCNPNLALKFVKHDINPKFENYVFLSDTVKDYKKIKQNLNAKVEYLPINSGVNTFKIENYDFKKPSVVYVLNLYLSEKTYKIAKKIELFKTPLGVFCKIIIE